MTILMADDDKEDCRLSQEALNDSRLLNEMRFVYDGEELMDYLRGRGEYGDGGRDAPEPGIILLDLNMPKMGRRWPRSRPTQTCGRSRSSC